MHELNNLGLCFIPSTWMQADAFNYQFAEETKLLHPKYVEQISWEN